MFTDCLLPKRLNVFQHLTISARHRLAILPNFVRASDDFRWNGDVCVCVCVCMRADLEWVLNIQSCSVRKFARALIAFSEKYCKIQFTILHQF